MNEPDTTLPEGEEQESKVSPLFNNADADLVFQSSDGTRFRILSKHLESTTEGFPVSEHLVTDQDSPVILPENSEVLGLLFQFVHPPTTRPDNWRQPNVNKLEAGLFFSLAEAAEKYVVFGAMNVCFMRMDSELYRVEACQVLNHAYLHGYTELADKAALSAIHTPLVSVALSLHKDLLGKFVIYRDHWEAIVRAVIEGLDRESFCVALGRALRSYLKLVATDLWNAGVLPSTETTGCSRSSCRCRRLPYIKTAIQETASQIPSFSSSSSIPFKVEYDFGGWDEAEMTSSD